MGALPIDLLDLGEAGVMKNLLVVLESKASLAFLVISLAYLPGYIVYGDKHLFGLWMLLNNSNWLSDIPVVTGGRFFTSFFIR